MCRRTAQNDRKRPPAPPGPVSLHSGELRGQRTARGLSGVTLCLGMLLLLVKKKRAPIKPRRSRRP
eukprot:4868222-Prymnesium_polylepis.1